MKKLSFLLAFTFMATMTARSAARDAEVPLPEPALDFSSLIAANGKSGRPYSGVSENDLRPVVPTLRNHRLELPCTLATINFGDTDPLGDNGFISAFDMELLLLGSGKTWAFVSFESSGKKPRGKACIAE